MERRAGLKAAAAPWRRLCAAVVIAIGASAALHGAQPADPILDAALDVRRTGCEGRPGIEAPLTRDRALDSVARRWAAQGAGGRLDVAFEAERVRARQSASLALLKTPPAAIGTAIRQRLCTELTDATWARIGWHGDPRGVWLVVAEPSEAPVAANAEATAAAALRLANALRARGARCGTQRFGPAPPLRLAAALTQAAQVHANDMARHRYLAHAGRDGSTPAQRASRAGYAWRLVGENVAAGPESAAEVMDGWERSPDHCRNLMDPEFTEMGLAFAANPQPTGHSTWWSMVLARPR